MVGQGAGAGEAEASPPTSPTVGRWVDVEVPDYRGAGDWANEYGDDPPGTKIIQRYVGGECTAMVDGDPNAPILLIAMSPGREELAGNKPLIGPSGKVTWAFARRGGWGRKDCYIINVIGEWPAKKSGAIAKEQIERYWDQFNEYLGRSKAQIAVCLGGDAFDRLTGIISADKREKRRSGIEAWRGYLVSPDECVPHKRLVVRHETYKKATKKHKAGDAKITRHKLVEESHLPATVRYILPTIHPSAVIRSGFATAPAFAADLARVGRALRGELLQQDFTWTETVQAFAPTEPVAVDIETRQPIPGDEETQVIVRAGLAGGNVAWTRPWDGETHKALEEALGVPGRPVVIHNSQFDVPLLEAEGIKFGGDIWDSMMAAVQVQPDLYKGLNSVASLMLDGPRWKHRSDAEPERYNATDAIKELQLYKPLCAELDNTGQRRLFEDVVMPGVRTLINMRVRGIKVHPQRAEEWRGTLQTKWDGIFNDWHKHTGGVDPGSNPKVHSYFYETLGMPSQYNKYGGTTCDEAALVAMRAYLTRQPDSPEKRQAWRSVELMLDYRETSTLLRNFAKSSWGSDGCVHPSYLPLQKDDDKDDTGKGMPGTGRVGARHPNMANQPQIARKMYIAHDPGMELVEADYSQIEAWVIATLSNDKALQKALEGDIHARNSELLGCDRVRAKNVFYGTAYGGGPRKLAKVLQGKGVAVTEQEMKALQSALAAAYPDWFRWRQRLIAEVDRNYYLTTPFDRRRYFMRGRGDAPAALDFPPQGTAADIMWHNLHPNALEAGFKSLGGALLLTVYDSALGEVPKGRRPETEAMLTDIMCREWPQIEAGFRVGINIKWGDSWGDLASTTRPAS